MSAAPTGPAVTGRATETDVDVLVVGAGVAGLAAAHVLHGHGARMAVIEAAATVGGRVRSARDAHGRHLGDLGPSWVWPPYQPHAAAWLERLGIDTVEQFGRGDAVVERAPGRTERLALPGQHGQRRPVGGPQALVDALAAGLPDGSVATGTALLAVDAPAGNGGATVRTSAGTIAADRVVLALPLRVLARDVASSTTLDPGLLALLRRAPTWMAGQAKAVVVYRTPFWRAAGLSGRIASAVGPLVEVHDHCGPDGSPAALTGFVGLSAAARRELAAREGPEALVRRAVGQLARCLGPEAADPIHASVEDWAADPRIATDEDASEPGVHPAVLPAAVRASLADGRIHLAAAETAAGAPGLLDGALEAGTRAAHAALGGRAPGR